MNKEPNIAVLGPIGTYSCEAAKRYEPDARLTLCETIIGVLEKVSTGESLLGIVPYENSIQGIVSEALDGLHTYNLVAQNQVILDIHHSLYALEKPLAPDSVTSIYSHPQALAQCHSYMLANYPRAKAVPVTSTTAGLQHLLNRGDKNELAIGPDFGASAYGLVTLDKNIEDEKNNQTRFLVCAKTRQRNADLDFILVAIMPKVDRPGLLRDILSVIADSGINLSQIESRPQRTRLDSYMFYLRLNMPHNDPRFDKLAQKLELQGVSIARLST